MICTPPPDRQGGRLPFLRSAKGTGSWNVPSGQCRLDHLFSLVKIEGAIRRVHAPKDSIGTDHPVQDGESKLERTATVSVLFLLCWLRKVTGAQKQR